jgi:hypothetical protein
MKLIIKDLIGKRFGKLTVITYAGRQGKYKRHCWLCKCDCGKKIVRRESHLIYGQVTSCNCSMTKKGKDARSYSGYEGLSGKYYGTLKRGATYRNRNFKFLVSIQFLWELFVKQNQKCALTNLPISFSETSRSKSQTASLDRIDSTKGYIEGNVQWVHKDVNKMKVDFDQHRFIEICNLVASQQKTDIITL